MTRSTSERETSLPPDASVGHGRASLLLAARVLAFAGLVLIPFYTEWRVFGAHLTSTQVVLSVSVLLWFLARWPVRPLALPLFLPLMAFLGTCALGVLHAADPARVLKETVQLSWLVGVFWMFADLTAERDFLRTSVRLALLAAPVAAAVGLVGYWLVSEPHGAIHIHRARAAMPFGQPNVYASYLAAFIPLGVALLCGVARRREKALIGLAVLVVTFGLCASYSRAGWLGAFAGTAVVAVGVLGARGGRRLLAPMSLVGAAVVLFTIDVSSSRPSVVRPTTVQTEAPPAAQTVKAEVEVRHQPPVPLQRTDGYLKSSVKHETDSERLLLIKVAWRMWRDHGILGIGLGNFPHHLLSYAPPEYRRRPDQRHEFVHLLPLHVLTELGIPGVLTSLWLLGAWCLRTFRVVRAATGEERLLRLGLLGGALAVLATGMLGWPFIRGPQEALAFMAAGCCVLSASASSRARQQEGTRERRAGSAAGEEPRVSVNRVSGSVPGSAPGVP